MAMTKDEYQELKASPLFKKFNQYLLDYRSQLMERWAQGAYHPDNPESLMAVARCQMADELATLDDDSISQFYRSATKGETDVQAD